jgi:hypothetical protein
VIRGKPTQQPHDLDIASGLSFQPPARLHPVQISLIAASIAVSRVGDAQFNFKKYLLIPTAVGSKAHV